MHTAERIVVESIYSHSKDLTSGLGSRSIGALMLLYESVD